MQMVADPVQFGLLLRTKLAKLHPDLLSANMFCQEIKHNKEILIPIFVGDVLRSHPPLCRTCTWSGFHPLCEDSLFCRCRSDGRRCTRLCPASKGSGTWVDRQQQVDKLKWMENIVISVNSEVSEKFQIATSFRSDQEDEAAGKNCIAVAQDTSLGCLQEPSGSLVVVFLCQKHGLLRMQIFWHLLKNTIMTLDPIIVTKCKENPRLKWMKLSWNQNPFRKVDFAILMTFDFYFLFLQKLILLSELDDCAHTMPILIPVSIWNQMWRISFWFKICRGSSNSLAQKVIVLIHCRSRSTSKSTKSKATKGVHAPHVASAIKIYLVLGFVESFGKATSMQLLDLWDSTTFHYEM